MLSNLPFCKAPETLTKLKILFIHPAFIRHSYASLLVLEFRHGICDVSNTEVTKASDNLRGKLRHTKTGIAS